MESGFSLIDLVVTLAITGTVLGTAAISLQRIGERHTLMQATHRLRLTLEDAYVQALKTRIPTTLTVAPHQILVATPNSLYKRVVPFPVSVLLTPHTPGQSTITMYPSLAVSPRQIDVTHGRVGSSVIISLRGRVRIEWR